MEELERQKEKYDALEKTWMAANQQFMEFQVSPDRDVLNKVIHLRSPEVT